MTDIKYKYMDLKETPSDINEHLETLYTLAKECETITEAGVRGVVASWALALGLLENGAPHKKLTGVDISPCPIDRLRDACQKSGIEYRFIQANDIKVDYEKTDLFFIDTWHVYGHLKRELALIHSKVNKYIVLHDTTVDEELGESIRCNFDIEQQARDSGYPVEEVRRGLWPAVEEFLEEHPEWELKHRYTHNNGLTILSRRCYSSNALKAIEDSKPYLNIATNKVTELKTSTIKVSVKQAVQPLDIAIKEIQKQGVSSTATVTLNLGVLQLSLCQKIEPSDAVNTQN